MGPDPYGNGSCKITIDSEGYHEEPRVLIVTVKDPQILRENNDCFCRNISAVPAQRVIATQWENNRIGTSQILPDLGFSQNDVGCFFFFLDYAYSPFMSVFVDLHFWSLLSVGSYLHIEFWLLQLHCSPLRLFCSLFPVSLT